MNILLIDKRVSRYEDIVAAIDPALAVGVVFDYFEDTFDTVKARIGALANSITANGMSVGLLQHNYRTPMFSMLASADIAPVSSVAAQDPELARWTQFRDFIAWCKTEHGAAHFDMMACALYSNKDWKYVIDTLTAQTGVTVRASTDNTGSAALGGDWFLESHTGVNLKTVYFTEAIEEYRGILYLTRYNIREYSTKGFATGSVKAWGSPALGGTTPVNVGSGVVAVYSTVGAFAALKIDGSVVAWGDAGYGGTTPGNVGSGVVAVYSTYAAFAALKSDGSVVAWGDSMYGGILSIVSITTYDDPYTYTSVESNLTSGVVAVYSTYAAFTALKSDGSVQAWGDSTYGGSAPTNATTTNSGVVAVYSTNEAFAALKTDGSVVAWGYEGSGGTTPENVISNIVAVYSTYYAFAALKTDGSLVVWGGNYSGIDPNIVGGVVAVYSTFEAFAALKSDGSVVAWGESYLFGGTIPVNVNVGSGVVAVYSTDYSFAALKTDGSVQVWGYSDYGGTNPGITGDAVAVYSTETAFAALKTTATTFDLSAAYYSNKDRYDILRKKENRRRVNLTTLNNNTFTLSQARDIQSFNPTMPTDKVLRIIVPDYTASSYSITSAATVPSTPGNYIIACDEGERVTVSGTTYVNYGTYVYRVETDNTYTKLTTATIGGTSFTLYGGDGINSSGVALISSDASPPPPIEQHDTPSTTTIKAGIMPPHLYPASSDSMFSTGRTTFARTSVPANAATITAAEATKRKQIYDPHNASSRMERLKMQAIGQSSMRVKPGEELRFKAPNVNDTRDAVRRMRSGGYVAPAKSWNKPI